MQVHRILVPVSIVPALLAAPGGAADLVVPSADPARFVLDVYADTQCPTVCGECDTVPRCLTPPCLDEIGCCDTWGNAVANQNARSVPPDFTYLNGDLGITNDAILAPQLATKFLDIWNAIPGPKSWGMGNHEADPGYQPGGVFYWVDPDNYYAPANWWEPLFGCDSTTAIENCRRWYSVYLGSPPRAALLVVNNNSDTDFDADGYEWCTVPQDSLNHAGSSQRLWLAAQIDSLPASVDVVFVAGHRTYYGVENYFPRPNVYTSASAPGQAPAETLRTGAVSFLRDLESIYDRKPNVKRVFMVSGDQHCFAETVPIRHNVRDDARGVVYLTVGIGGACNNRATPFPKLSKIPSGTLVHAFDDRWGGTRLEIRDDRVDMTLFEAYTDSVLYTRSWPLDPASAVPVAPPRSDARLRVWPNPAAQDVRMALSVPAEAAGDVEDWAIFDVRGQRVVTLNAGSYADGEYRRAWDLLDGAGRRVPAGVYFVRARTAATSFTARVLVGAR